MTTRTHRNASITVPIANPVPVGTAGGTMAALALALAVALAATPSPGQTQDRIDHQQIETVPAGPSDVTVAPEAGDAVPSGGGETAAGATIDEQVEAASRDPETGQIEAAEGGAEPTENWFGCKPAADGSTNACDEAARAAQEGGQSASQ